MSEAVGQASEDNDKEAAHQRGDRHGKAKCRDRESQLLVHIHMDIEERHGKEPEGEQAKDKSEEDSIVALVGCGGCLLHRVMGEAH